VGAQAGAPASNDTEVRFFYDDNNLYIGVRVSMPTPAA